jgi:hypothetical protein
MTDPRPDLAYDSEDWTNLLNIANCKNSLLAWILHGFRCCGLRLHRGREGWALRPELDPNASKWTTKEEYFEDRDRWLVQYQKEIAELLKTI